MPNLLSMKALLAIPFVILLPVFLLFANEDHSLKEAFTRITQEEVRVKIDRPANGGDIVLNAQYDFKTLEDAVAMHKENPFVGVRIKNSVESVKSILSSKFWSCSNNSEKVDCSTLTFDTLPEISFYMNDVEIKSGTSLSYRDLGLVTLKMKFANTDELNEALAESVILSKILGVPSSRIYGTGVNAKARENVMWATDESIPDTWKDLLTIKEGVSSDMLKEPIELAAEWINKNDVSSNTNIASFTVEGQNFGDIARFKVLMYYFYICTVVAFATLIQARRRRQLIALDTEAKNQALVSLFYSKRSFERFVKEAILLAPIPLFLSTFSILSPIDYVDAIELGLYPYLALYVVLPLILYFTLVSKILGTLRETRTHLYPTDEVLKARDIIKRIFNERVAAAHLAVSRIQAWFLG